MSLEFAATSVFNPTAEEAFWRDAYRTEPYYRAEFTYDDHGPAYRLSLPRSQEEPAGGRA